MSVEEETEFGVVFPGKVAGCVEKPVIVGMIVITELVLAPRSVLRANFLVLWGQWSSVRLLA